MTVLPYMEDGRPRLDLALVSNFYLRDGHTLVVRERIVEALGYYVAAVGDELHHYSCAVGGGRGRWRRFQPDRIANIAAALFGSVGKIWEIYLTGGAEYEVATPFVATGIGIAEWQQKSWNGQSFVQFLLPWTWFAYHEGDFPAFFRKLSFILKPQHGFGGLGFASSVNVARQREMSKSIYLIANKIPGLIVEDGYFEANQLSRGIREGNFLTALNDEWAARLGGADAIAAALGDPFIVNAYEGGLTIQAGVEPNPIGPSIYQPAPADPPPAAAHKIEASVVTRDAAALYPLYHRLNRVLRPIRIKPEDVQGALQVDHYEKKDFFDHERTLKWISRFD